MDVPLPSEFRYRWFLQAILRRMDKGKSASSKQEFEAYMEKPFLTPNPGTTYCWLPNICSMAADGVDTSKFFKWKESLGQPQNLTESEFDDNIANIHAVNNRNLHPAQRKIAQSQSQ